VPNVQGVDVMEDGPIYEGDREDTIVGKVVASLFS
jgi:hypothetical protein